jgi:hypothetical protein
MADEVGLSLGKAHQLYLNFKVKSVFKIKFVFLLQMTTLKLRGSKVDLK